jgi:hypothetical protein
MGCRAAAWDRVATATSAPSCLLSLGHPSQQPKPGAAWREHGSAGGVAGLCRGAPRPAPDRDRRARARHGSECHVDHRTFAAVQTKALGPRRGGVRANGCGALATITRTAGGHRRCDDQRVEGAGSAVAGWLPAGDRRCAAEAIVNPRTSAPLPCPAPGRALPAQSRRLRPALRLKREISATGLCRRATAEPCLLPLSPGTRAAAFGAPRLMNDEQRSPSGLTIASPRRCARSTVVVVVVVAVQRRSGHATARRGGCRRRSEVGGRGRGWERGGPRGARRGWRHSARGCGRRCSGCTRWRGRCGVRAALATALP